MWSGISQRENYQSLPGRITEREEQEIVITFQLSVSHFSPLFHYPFFCLSVCFSYSPHLSLCSKQLSLCALTPAKCPGSTKLHERISLSLLYRHLKHCISNIHLWTVSLCIEDYYTKCHLCCPLLQVKRYSRGRRMPARV